MAVGPVPTSGYRMYIDDDSIAKNVQGTHASSTLYTTFDNLRTNLNNQMIHSSYGTKGSNPTNSDQFRGYPKPTITMNYEQVYNSPSTPKYQQLWVDHPTMNNKVGFSTTVTFVVDEYRDDTNGLLGSHTETILFNSGSTSVSSSPSSMPYAAGTGWRLTDYAATSSYDVDVEVTITANRSGLYFGSGESSFETFTNNYDNTPSAYAHTYEDIDSLSCSGAISGGSTTCYSADQTLDSSSTLYTTTALTTTIPDGQYALNAEDDTYFSYADVESGNCNSYTECP